MARSSSELIPEDTQEKAVEILKAIAHPGHLQIVNILLNGECQVSEIQRVMGTKQAGTSNQLNKLKLRVLLKSRRDGNKVYYSLANDSIKKIIATIIAEL